MVGSRDSMLHLVKATKRKINAMNTMTNQTNMPDRVRKNTAACKYDKDKVEIPLSGVKGEVKILPKLRMDTIKLHFNSARVRNEYHTVR